MRNNQEALSHLTRVLAALVYGNELKMAHLCQHFKQVMVFLYFILKFNIGLLNYLYIEGFGL